MKKRQRGHFLVHAAEAMVGIALLGIAVVQGQNWWEETKVKSVYTQLKELETLVWDYREEYGRWPGDCDNNGVIDRRIAIGAVKSLSLLHKSQTCNESDGMNSDPNLESVKSSNQVEFYIESILVEGKIANAIIINNIHDEALRFLDSRIDGTSAIDSGRVIKWSSESQSVFLFDQTIYVGE